VARRPAFRQHASHGDLHLQGRVHLLPLFLCGRVLGGGIPDAARLRRVHVAARRAARGPGVTAKRMRSGVGRSRSRALSALTHGFLVFVSIATLYPIIQIVTVSLRPADRLYSTSLAVIPKDATLAAFRTMLFEK